MNRQSILIWTPVAISALASLAAVSVSGQARSILLLVALLGALSLALVVSRLGRTVETDIVLGGSGYAKKLPGGVLALHGMSTALYLLGIFVVIVAGLARLDFITRDFPTAWATYMPAGLAIFVGLAGAGASWRYFDEGFSNTWYSRLHSIFLLVVGSILATTAIFHVFGASFITANDVLILVLVGILGVGTQMMLATGLPTPIDLVGAASRRVFTGKDEDTQDTPPVVYAGIIAIVATVAIVFLTLRFEVLTKFGGINDERSVFLIIVLPLILAIFFTVSAFQLWRESRRGLYRQRLSTKLRNDLMVYGISTMVGLVFAAMLARLLLNGDYNIGPIPVEGDSAKDLIMLVIVSTTLPIGLYIHKEYTRVGAIEDRLPDLLNDLAESRRAGLTLPVALRAATRSDYGPLSDDVKKMADQVDWGVPFNEAFAQFGRRTKTPLVRRSVQLVIEASRTGGSIADILKAAAKDIHDLKTIEHDRRISMATYLIVIYVVFFVFLVVLGALETKFIPEILKAGSDIKTPTAGLAISKLDPEDLRFVYFNAAMVQALGNGMVAGVLTEGRLTAGFRHVAIMAFFGWAVFRLALGL